MRLSSLDARGSFALLGPGFGGGRWLLLEGLGEAAGPDRLVYAAFETPGPSALVLGARACPVEVTWDVVPAAPRVTLHAGGYREAVGRIRAAIAAGDVYQVCHTVRAGLEGPGGAGLLARMCRDGVPRFAAWVRLPDGTELVSASPELFFELDGTRIHSEPMKGTARPDASGALATSDKDRSELAMITDLVRNDLTPVCRPRSVRVACARRFIELPYAVQAVSDVEGTLDDGAGPLEVLAALHPGGSVTGAPKEAALAMIRELEASPRGAYCGALGLWQVGRTVCSLLIRTAQRTPAGWVYGTGGGIVWDSEAEQELEEVRVKLGAF